MRVRQEEGQAVILLVVAMGIFLLGAGGLAIDGSNIYGEREKAQTAADATAQAAIMSIFDGTNTNNIKTNGAGFTAADKGTLTCNNTYQTPCYYAAQNGFSSASGDTITLKFYNASDTPTTGVSLSDSSTDPVSVVQVTISHSVGTTLLRLFGTTATTVKAVATAAIVSVTSPTPMLITDPVGSGSLSTNGSTTIQICGGPTRSIQVNSSSSSAVSAGGAINLTDAGPGDSGDCSVAAGADFGVFGGPSTNPGITLGTGRYLSGASPIRDPLASVPAPSKPGGVTNPPTTNITTAGTHGCMTPPCVEYSPGYYTSLVPGKNTVIFDPGLYYVDGGGVDFKQTVGGGTNFNAMCVGCTADPDTGAGMVIYDTGPTNAKGFAASGGFTIDTNAQLTLQGSTKTVTEALGVDGCTVVAGCVVPASPYYGILFWENRNAVAQTHQLGQGNGCFTLIGTIYITNTQAIMTNTSDPNYPHTQSVTYNGTPCSTTVVQGDIIVGDLTLKGNVAIKMELVPYGFLQVRQVALVQ